MREIIAWKYRYFLKPILFQFDAETVHNTFTSLGKAMGNTSLMRALTQHFLRYQHPSLVKTIDGITFPNPVGLSAGFDYNGELTDILPAVGFGFHTIGTVTWKSYEGNPKPRLGRYPKSQALLVNKGLKGLGARAIVKKLTGKKFAIPTGISIASTNCLFKDTREQLLDILQSFVVFEKSAVQHSYYEMNISCPNTFGGEPFTSPARLELLLSLLDQLNITRPVYIKMPIDQSEEETLQLLKVIDRHQIAGVIFGNLTKDKSNPDIEDSERQLWQTARGNLSGKPTWHRSNNLIKLTKKQYGDRFTIIGCGGIFNGEDAQIKMELGADLLQLITGMIYNGPQVIGQINQHLAHHRLHPGT